MPKKSNLKNMVEKLLEDKDLSKKELNYQLKEVYNKNFSDKTLNEVLVKLLKEEKIDLVGYDLSIYDGMKRIQSLKPDGMIFGSLKIDKIEIEVLFRKLDSENLETVKNAHSKLRKIFLNRLKNVKLIEILKKCDITINDDLFDDLIYYINSKDLEQKRTLIEKLIWALTNREDSDKIFSQIIQLSRLYAHNK
ncbi:MAG: hypothetical protein ACP5C3_06580 [Methanomicrobiales archaeon]